MTAAMLMPVKAQYHAVGVKQGLHEKLLKMEGEFAGIVHVSADNVELGTGGKQPVSYSHSRL